MCYHLTKTYISSETPKIKLGEFWITQSESFETQLIQFSHHVDLCFGLNPKCTQLDLLTPKNYPHVTWHYVTARANHVVWAGVSHVI